MTIPEGSKVTMTVGPNTYEYVAGKAQPLPFNKESRDWIHEVPLNLSEGEFKIPMIPTHGK